MRKLSLYHWPGNVRELENVIERAVILCVGDRIQSYEIDLPICADSPQEAESFRESKARLVGQFEREYLQVQL